MSGLRAIPLKDDPVADDYVRSIVSVCDTHRLSRGTAMDLAVFLEALDGNKHMAMDFWSIVARLSDECGDLSIQAINGAVLEAVTKAITGRSVAEMIAAGVKSRRLVGDLGSLLAGEDLNSPATDSVADVMPIKTEVVAAEAGTADVEKLRADVERLKAAFEARFGSEPVPPVAPVGTNADVASSLGPVMQAVPPPPTVFRAQAVASAHSIVDHDTIYAAAQALSGAGAADGTGFVKAGSTRELEVPSAPITFDSEKIAVAVNHSERRAYPWVISLGIVLVVALGAIWWWSNSSGSSNARDGGSRGDASSSAPTAADHSNDLVSSARPYTVTGVLAAGSRSPEVKAGTLRPSADLSVPLLNEAPRVVGRAKEEGAPPPLAQISGLTGTTAVAELPGVAAVLPTASEMKVAAVNASPRVAPGHADIPISPLEAARPSGAVPKAAITSVPERVSAGVVVGAKISGANPIYPQFARSAHISGAVTLHAMISKTGNVGDIQVMSGPEALRQSAVEAVRTWKYKPFLLNGEPTEAGTLIVLKFNYDK